MVYLSFRCCFDLWPYCKPVDFGLIFRFVLDFFGIVMICYLVLFLDFILLRDWWFLVDLRVWFCWICFYLILLFCFLLLCFGLIWVLLCRLIFVFSLWSDCVGFLLCCILWVDLSLFACFVVCFSFGVALGFVFGLLCLMNCVFNFDFSVYWGVGIIPYFSILFYVGDYVVLFGLWCFVFDVGLRE